MRRSWSASMPSWAAVRACCHGSLLFACGHACICWRGRRPACQSVGHGCVGGWLGRRGAAARPAGRATCGRCWRPPALQPPQARLTRPNLCWHGPHRVRTSHPPPPPLAGDVILGRSQEELAALMASLGQPAYRAKQLRDGVMQASVEGMVGAACCPASPLVLVGSVCRGLRLPQQRRRRLLQRAASAAPQQLAHAADLCAAVLLRYRCRAPRAYWTSPRCPRTCARSWRSGCARRLPACFAAQRAARAALGQAAAWRAPQACSHAIAGPPPITPPACRPCRCRRACAPGAACCTTRWRPPTAPASSCCSWPTGAWWRRCAQLPVGRPKAGALAVASFC